MKKVDLINMIKKQVSYRFCQICWEYYNNSTDKDLLERLYESLLIARNCEIITTEQMLIIARLALDILYGEYSEYN